MSEVSSLVDSESSGNESAPLLRLRGLSKRFGATLAVKDATFEVRPGEVHALVGENGSGKSTLVKMLSGVHQPDRGGLSVAGVEHSGFAGPAAAQAAGIATVFQEVLTAENLTVLDNLWLGTDGLFRTRRSRRQKRQEAQRVLDALLENPPQLDMSVENLGLSDRQACGIARALLRRPKILILDEATSTLDFGTRERLFDIIRSLREDGTATILITHRMDEIDDLADRVTVLRSGTTVGTLDHSWDAAEMIRMMTGGEHLVQTAAREGRGSADGAVVLSVRELALRPDSAPIDFDLRAGELVGLAGLEGHGQDDFLRALSGRFSGEGEVTRRMREGTARAVRNPYEAHRMKIAYVPRDRRSESLFHWMSIVDNFTVPTIHRDTRFGLVSNVRARQRFEHYREKLNIKLGKTTDAITSLSGGNQQKVIIARWLATNPDVLLLNDPTRGIDVNAKRDLYRLLHELTQEGLSVVMLSTEVDEHVELMDRVLVFREHSIERELTVSELTRQNVVLSFFGTEER